MGIQTNCCGQYKAKPSDRKKPKKKSKKHQLKSMQEANEEECISDEETKTLGISRAHH
jgi:hypothetical protein